jgi:hypothetical protein
LAERFSGLPASDLLRDIAKQHREHYSIHGRYGHRSASRHGSFRRRANQQEGGLMKCIFVPTRSGSDWQPLLAEPTKHWKKGKSAMTAAACWEAAPSTLPPELRAVLNSSGDADIADLKLLAAMPEWTVPLVGGDTASQTDVLALARNDHGLCVLAVEAKVDEDFGPTLAEKRKKSSAGQTERLDQLHRLLGVGQLQDGIRYQLVHRTASAILVAQEFHARTAVMLVHSFGSRTSLREDFDAFGQAMNAAKIADDVLVVPSMDRPRLFLVWCNGDRRFLRSELPGIVEISATEGADTNA